jgi:hypothetical protein
MAKKKLFLIIPTLVLIPILLGLTPLCSVCKIGSGCIFDQGKQLKKCNPSLNHGTISPGIDLPDTVNQGFFIQPLLSWFPVISFPSTLVISSTTPQSADPLRC